MKTKNIFLIASLGIAAAFLFMKKKSATDLKFRWLGVKFTGKKLSDFKLWVQLEVVNQNNSSLSFKNLFADITETGSQNLIGSIQINDKIDIPANTSTIVNLPIKFRYYGLTYLLGEIILKGKKPIFDVVGSLDTLGVQIKIQEKLNLF